MEQVLGSVSFQIPHSREVETQYLLSLIHIYTENTSYAAETLLAMHQAFEEVYGEGYVDESYGMVMMPAVRCV